MKPLLQFALGLVEFRSQTSAPTPAHEVRIFEASELRFTDATDDQPPRLSGYAAKFDVLSHPLATPRGKFREKIQKGAFRSALATGGNTVFRMEHGKNGELPLADTATKTLRLKEDDVGLRFEADLDPNDPDVQRMLPKVRRGTLREMSFAFTVDKGGDAWERRDGELTRTVTSVGRLIDVAPVTFPAYPETSLAMRSLVQWEIEHHTSTEDETRASTGIAASITPAIAAALRGVSNVFWTTSWSLENCASICTHCTTVAMAGQAACQAAAVIASQCASGNVTIADCMSACRSTITILAAAREVLANCPDGYAACLDAATACTAAEQAATDCIGVCGPAAGADDRSDKKDNRDDSPAPTKDHRIELRRRRLQLDAACE